MNNPNTKKFISQLNDVGIDYDLAEYIINGLNQVYQLMPLIGQVKQVNAQMSDVKEGISDLYTKIEELNEKIEKLDHQLKEWEEMAETQDS